MHDARMPVPTVTTTQILARGYQTMPVLASQGGPTVRKNGVMLGHRLAKVYGLHEEKT